MCREAFCSQWLSETDRRLTGLSLCALDDDRLASRAFRFELACILWPSELESQFDIENTFLPTDLCNLFTFSLFNIHSSKNKLLGWIQFSIYIPGFLS